MLCAGAWRVKEGVWAVEVKFCQGCKCSAGTSWQRGLAALGLVTTGSCWPWPWLRAQHIAGFRETIDSIICNKAWDRFCHNNLCLSQCLTQIQ